MASQLERASGRQAHADDDSSAGDNRGGVGVTAGEAGLGQRRGDGQADFPQIEVPANSQARTYVSLQALEGDERVEELARVLAGERITELIGSGTAE